MLHSFDQQKADVHLKQVSLYLTFRENIVCLCFLIRAYVSVCDDGDPCTDLQGGERGQGITFILMSYYRLLTALLSHAISCAFLLAQWVLQAVLFRRHSRESRKAYSVRLFGHVGGTVCQDVT